MPSNNMEECENDIIVHLLESVFKVKSDNDKLNILQKGRPQPKLVIIKKDSSKNCSRTFQECWYEIHTWLCGSTNLNKLFCWPCLLMKPESSTWCSTGVDDVKRLATIASKHSSCKSHLKAIAEYDAIMVGYSLPPQFVKEANYNCKVEQQEALASSDSEDDLFDQYFIIESSKSKGIKKEHEAPKNSQPGEVEKEGKTRISFKAWRELNSHVVSSEHVHESQVLFKWKRKIARQDLYNSRLKARKLRLEIELLKTKLDYHNSLKSEIHHGEGSSPKQIPTNSTTV